MRHVRLIAVVTLIAASVTVSAAAAPTVGQKRVLIVLGTTASAPYSVAAVRDVAAAVTSFYRTSSRGQLELRFDVSPWLTAFQADPGCNIFGVNGQIPVMEPARAAAQAAGYTISDYDVVVYAVANSRCGFQGVDIGSEIVLMHEPTLELLAHELGHAFGLGHARGASCTNGFACILFDPGDPFSPMGTGEQLLDFSVYEKTLLGWVPPQPHIATNGKRILSAANNAHALVIDTAEGRYWLEYRTRPFTGVIVRFVVARQTSTVGSKAPSATLMFDPGGNDHDWLARGEAFHAKDDGLKEIFQVRLLTTGPKQAQIQFTWTDRRAPSSPYVVHADPASTAATHLDWAPSRDEGSGVSYYAVRVDAQPLVRVSSTQLDVSKLTAGLHRVSVVAVDHAGNRSRPSRLSFVVS